MATCRQCNKVVKKTNEYTPITCGKSECQEAEYYANKMRYRKAKRIKPKSTKLSKREQKLQDLDEHIRQTLTTYWTRDEFDLTLPSAKECLERACYDLTPEVIASAKKCCKFVDSEANEFCRLIGVMDNLMNFGGNPFLRRQAAEMLALSTDEFDQLLERAYNLAGDHPISSMLKTNPNPPSKED